MKVNPSDKWTKCLNKKLKVFPDAEIYARLLAALYTGKNEKPASNIKTAQSVLSPSIFSKILFIIIFLLLL